MYRATKQQPSTAFLACAQRQCLSALVTQYLTNTCDTKRLAPHKAMSKQIVVHLKRSQDVTI